MKLNVPTPRLMLWGGYAVILSSAAACPFALSMPALTVLIPAALLGLLFITARLTGRDPASIPPECRRMLWYGLIFNAVCFCSQAVCSAIPAYLAHEGVMPKNMLVQLGFCNLLIHLLAVIALITAAVRACTMLRKNALGASRLPRHPVCE